MVNLPQVIPFRVPFLTRPTRPRSRTSVCSLSSYTHLTWRREVGLNLLLLTWRRQGGSHVLKCGHIILSHGHKSALLSFDQQKGLQSKRGRVMTIKQASQTCFISALPLPVSAGIIGMSTSNQSRLKPLKSFGSGSDEVHTKRATKMRTGHQRKGIPPSNAVEKA